jgi:uncharacterized membrane protein
MEVLESKLSMLEKNGVSKINADEQKHVEVKECEVLEDEVYIPHYDQEEGLEVFTSSIPHVSITEQIVSSEETVIKSSFEHNLATKLPVWVGSVSLIFAAFFLVKYSIEYGWLGPIARVTIGALFSGALIVGGCFASKRPYISNAEHISQGLIGAGLVGLYVSLYASINLYEIMPEFIGFIGMAGVTTLAVILSLRYGQTIAAFGVVGGLLTPAMVGSTEPNTIGLFVYLFLLFSGLYSVLTRRGWWGLAMFVLLGMFGWSAIWFAFAFTPSEASVLTAFSMGLVAVVLIATGRRTVITDGTLSHQETDYIHSLNIAAIAGGVLTLVGLGFKANIGLFDWSMLGILSVALIVLTYFKPNNYQRYVWVKLSITLALLSIWMQEATLGEALSVIAGISVIYVGGATILMRWVSDPRLWVSVQCVSALFLYLISYWMLELPDWLTSSFAMIWGILALILATLSILSAANIHNDYKTDSEIQDYLMAIYSFMASAFISLGLAIELPWEYVPLAFAGQIAATAWIYQYSKISFLQNITYILTIIFVSMNYDQIILFGNIIFNSIVGSGSLQHVVKSFMLDNPVIKLGAPAGLFYASLWGFIRASQVNDKLIQMLFGVANLLILAMGYYLFKEATHIGSGYLFSIETGFLGRGFLTMLLVGAGIGIVELTSRYDIKILQPWGIIFFSVAMLRFVYFDLFMHNPYWSSNQFVGNWPFFNGVSITYGLGFAAAAWAFYNKDLMARSEEMYKLYAFTALFAIFALVSLNVRQIFHGGFLDSGSIGSAEMYSYSVAWLLSGLVFLAAGIKMQNKSLRLVSLIFITLVVFKVFLFDAAELEGLYRVFSFLGLGFSLIGLSHFYSRFVSDKAG